MQDRKIMDPAFDNSSESKVRVAVDAMGGDHGPSEVVDGVVEAAQSQKNVEIILVGDPEPVNEALSKHPDAEGLIRVVPSEGKIGDDEHPVHALRQKPKSSVVVATALIKQGKADALVTMGSTGAAMASSALMLGTLDGLERPCLGGPFLGLAPKAMAVDMGSNVDCRPSLLLDFAAMGCVFSRLFLGIENPRVGLLSVGSEKAKGNRQVTEGYELFQKSSLNFVGNVEGMDFFTNKADVIVCDGFVGNILMKFTEGLGAVTAKYVKQSLNGKLPDEDLAAFAANLWEVNNLPKKMGGPLFGVNGVVLIGHGASEARGVAGAIDTARRCVELNLVEGLKTGLADLRSAAKT